MILRINKELYKIIVLCISYVLLLLGSVSGFYSIKYYGLSLLLLLILKDFKEKPLKKEEAIIFVLVFVVGIISIPFQNITIGQSVSSLAYYLVLFLISVRGYSVFTSYKQIRAVTIIISVIAIVVLLFSRSELLYQYTTLRQFTGRLRLYGLFNHVNTFAYLCALIMISYDVVRGRKHILSNSILIIIFGVFLLLTDSRGAMAFAGFYFGLNIYIKLLEKYNFSYRNKFLITCVLMGVASFIFFKYVLVYVFSQATYANRMAVFKEISGSISEIVFGRGMVDASSVDYSNVTG